MSSFHYVARFIIERVDHIDVKKPGGTMNSILVDDTRRSVTQLANITVRADTLVDIITKVPKHLELIDDIEAIDPETPKGVR